MIEKLLKAAYIKHSGAQPPRIHNLLRIAKECGLALTTQQEDFLLEVTTYNIKGRYPDYQQRFRRKADLDFTAEKIALIKETRQWLKENIAK